MQSEVCTTTCSASESSQKKHEPTDSRCTCVLWISIKPVTNKTLQTVGNNGGHGFRRTSWSVSAYMALAFVFGFIQINWWWRWSCRSCTIVVWEPQVKCSSIQCNEWLVPSHARGLDSSDFDPPREKALLRTRTAAAAKSITTSTDHATILLRYFRPNYRPLQVPADFPSATALLVTNSQD